VDAGDHFVMAHRIAAFGIFNAALNTGKKFGLLFEHTGHGFFDYLRGVFALAGSKVLKLGFAGG
jgi:hypothetical protein